MLIKDNRYPMLLQDKTDVEMPPDKHPAPPMKEPVDEPPLNEPPGGIPRPKEPPLI